MINIPSKNEGDFAELYGEMATELSQAVRRHIDKGLSVVGILAALGTAAVPLIEHAVGEYGEAIKCLVKLSKEKEGLDA